MRTAFLGTGFYVPDRVVTNDELGAMMDTSDEWIRTRTRIEQRHWVGDGKLGSDLALEASRMALSRAGLEPGDVDAIVYATVSPDYFFPGGGRLPPDQAGPDHDPLPGHPQPMHRIPVRPPGRGRLDPLGHVPAGPAGRLGGPVGRHRHEHAGPRHGGALRRRRGRRRARCDRGRGPRCALDPTSSPMAPTPTSCSATSGAAAIRRASPTSCSTRDCSGRACRAARCSSWPAPGCRTRCGSASPPTG